MFARRFAKSASRAFSTTASRLDVARMTLVGRIGAEPERLVSKNGNSYMKYPLAVSTSKDQTSWFNILAFDEPLIQFIEKYVAKGCLVYVEADASINKYVNEDGNSRTSLTLIQQSINPITWAKRDGEGEEAAPHEE